MRGVSVFHFVLGITAAFSVSMPTVHAGREPNDPNRYLNAVREFADSVLKYGRDTYGPEHTPLFVDGLNIHTHEPVKWISPKGDVLTVTETEEWIPSNFASQQTLLRTLDGLSSLTGDSKYCDAAKEAIKYAFENVRTPNGLFYWGQVAAYDALKDEVWGDAHTLKVHYPYYELMWQVNPRETKRFIEAYWSAHIIDWSNLDFNRMAIYADASGVPEAPWDHEYRGGPTFFRSKISWANGFFHTGTSLAQAATTLYLLSGQEQPLVWSQRLMQRFVDTRHPNTGISAHKYNKPQRRFVGGGMEEHFSDPRVGVFPFHPFVYPSSAVRELTYSEDVKPHQWLSVLLMGEELGEQGKEFTQWALEELTAWGKASYQAKDNVFMPILTDGTPIEGVVLEEDCESAPKGSTATPLFAGPGYLWLYASACKTTGDKFIWQMTRDIARGNGFGDIGEGPGQTPALNWDTANSDAYSLFGFLELYSSTKRREFLNIAKQIGDNILATKLHNGFFVPSRQHVYSRFDCYESLALLHLTAALTSQQKVVPRVWPSSPVFVPTYRYKEEGSDRRMIYALTEMSGLPLSLQEAATVGDSALVARLVGQGQNVNASEDTPKKTALHRAVISGHKDVVELLLSKGADVNREDGSGRVPLDYAMDGALQGKDLSIMKLLLVGGANPNLVRAGGVPLLSYAITRGRADVAELLLAHGADVDVKSRTGQRPLHLACQLGNKELVQLLIDKGADVNAKDNRGQTPWDMAQRSAQRTGQNEILELLKSKIRVSSIHIAAQLGDLERVKAFLEEGIDVNAKDENGDTPLHIAAEQDYNDIASLLIDQGGNVNARNQKNYTPLYNAISNSNKDLVGLLIGKGADVNVTPEGGAPLLIEAVWRGDLDVVKLLVDNGARYDTQDKDGLTALYYAASQGNMDMVKLFISKGIDESSIHMAACAGDLPRVKEFIEKGTAVDANDEAGWTALVWAVSAGQTEVAEFLIKNNADVNIRYDRQRQSLLHLAARSDAVRLVELLITKGADVNAKDQLEATPLFVAASAGHLQVVDLLISKGADVNATNRMRQTPLHWACLRGNKELAELLIAKGADANAKDGRGQTPLDIAQRRGGTGIIELLRKQAGPQPEQIQVHDVEITKVSAPTRCIQGETVSVAVALDNRGDHNESLGVTLTDVSHDKEIARHSLQLPSKHHDATEVDLTFVGETGGEQRFGDWLAAGDVNGDKYDDLAICATFSQSQTGKVYLYYGGPNMDNVADKVFVGEAAGDRFGCWGAASFCDMNHDGFDDLLIGARYHNKRGRAYVFYGGTDMDDKPDIIIDPPATDGDNCSFGRGIVGGDINGDGRMDLLISAPQYQGYTGRTYLYYGPIESDTDVDKVFTGENTNDTFGADLCIRGDVDGDGYNDLLIATRYYPRNSGTGRVYLYYGGPDMTMDEECDLVFDAENWGDRFGSSIDLFDIDHDGHADVIVGASEWGLGRGYRGNDDGRVYVYWGDDRDRIDNVADLRFGGEAGKAAHLGGSSVMGAYINQDEYGDIIACAMNYNNGQGRVYLYHGNARRSVDKTIDGTFTPETGENLPQRIVTADFNGDNHLDIAVGTGNSFQGKCWLWYGPFETTKAVTFNWDTTNVSIGKHTLKVEIPPVPGEQNTEDNVKTVTIEVKESMQ
jgi:pectate lyase